MRFEPQIEQKCLAVNSDEWNVLTRSLPLTQENCSDLIDARVLNAAPCQRLHLEQWQLKMGPSSPTMRYSDLLAQASSGENLLRHLFGGPCRVASVVWDEHRRGFLEGIGRDRTFHIRIRGSE